MTLDRIAGEREQKLTAYRAKLAAMDDAAFVEEVERAVWLSAYASNNGRSIYHAECDATYDEAKRREKLWLYQRGWNAAYRSCGYEPSESDLEAARSPS